MKRGGFTIIEILVVTTIIAILSTVVAFHVYYRRDSVSLRSASVGLSRSARYARLLAGEHHKLCRLHVNLDKGTYWLTVLVGQAADKQREATDALGWRVVKDVCVHPEMLAEDLRFSLAQVQGAATVRQGEIAITFNVDGSADAGLIQIGNEDETHTVLIYPCTAKVTLHSRTIDELPSDTIDLDALSSAARAAIFQ